MSDSIPIAVFAEIFYKEAINNFSVYDEYKKIIKYEGISRDDKKIEWEVFYLWIFLLSYCFQRKFVSLGDEKVRKILDAIHRHIYSKKSHPGFLREDLKNTHNLITLRYTQYYKEIKNDWEAMEKGIGSILFSALVSSFIENLIKRKTEFQEFVKFRIKFGLMISYLCRDLLDWFERIKSKYEIKFD